MKPDHAVDVDTGITLLGSLFQWSDVLVGHHTPGYCGDTGEVPTTLMPRSAILYTSAIACGIRLSPIAQYTAQSGLVASTASRSVVARIPDHIQPGQPPASLPTFSSAETTSPVSSKGRVGDQLGQRQPADVPGADADDAG